MMYLSHITTNQQKIHINLICFEAYNKLLYGNTNCFQQFDFLLH